MLTPLTSKIATRLAGQTPDERDLLECLEWCVAEHSLVDLLGAAVLPEYRATIAGRSYHHANGFTKIVLISYAPPAIPFELRLHVWPPAELPSDLPPRGVERVHNHGWSFASHVMTGALRFEEFALSPEGEPFVEYRYSRPGSALSYSKDRLGTARLSCIRRGDHLRGASYGFHFEQLHRTWPISSEPTATLMLQGPVVSKEGRIFDDPRYSGPSAGTTLAPLREEELSACIGRVITAIGRDPAAPHPMGATCS